MWHNVGAASSRCGQSDRFHNESGSLGAEPRRIGPRCVSVRAGLSAVEGLDHRGEVAIEQGFAPLLSRMPTRRIAEPTQVVG